MFKPLRFNPLLKAIPGLAHLVLTPQKTQHAPAHEHVEIDHVQAVPGGTKETHIREDVTRTRTHAHTDEQVAVNSVQKAHAGIKSTQIHGDVQKDADKTHTHVRTSEHVEVERLQAVPEGIKQTRVREDIQKDVKTRTHDGQTTTEVHKRVSEDIQVKTVGQTTVTTSETLTHVHATVENVLQIEMTPPHPPREETPIYQKTHHHLVFTKDTPCAICGVRNSTLQDPKENLFHAQAIETHHYPIERSLMNACDPRRVRVAFPEVKDYPSLEAFIDSEENMMVLCDIHHRHPHYGIHHILAQDFFIQPFLYGGYQVVAEAEEVDKVMVANERVIKRHLQHTETVTHK